MGDLQLRQAELNPFLLEPVDKVPDFIEINALRGLVDHVHLTDEHGILLRKNDKIPGVSGRNQNLHNLRLLLLLLRKEVGDATRRSIENLQPLVRTGGGDTLEYILLLWHKNVLLLQMLRRLQNNLRLILGQDYSGLNLMSCRRWQLHRLVSVELLLAVG